MVIAQYYFDFSEEYAGFGSRITSQAEASFSCI